MTKNDWSFEVFSNWVCPKADGLRNVGFVVEVQKTDGPRASIRLRAERLTRLGELTVWNDGMAATAAQLVLDLRTGDYLYDRDGGHLGGDPWTELDVFLSTS